jgi:hypothetical protein
MRRPRRGVVESLSISLAEVQIASNVPNFLIGCGARKIRESASNGKSGKLLSTLEHHAKQGSCHPIYISAYTGALFTLLLKRAHRRQSFD